jgi:hypothetical protein
VDGNVDGAVKSLGLVSLFGAFVGTRIWIFIRSKFGSGSKISELPSGGGTLLGGIGGEEQSLCSGLPLTLPCQPPGRLD